MKTISIDARLKEIASLIEPCNTIADVGTDHGYLPIYLIQTNKANLVYASDIAIGPLNSALANIEKYNLNDRITTILSNGLENVPDVDSVIMAGMGGNLIIDILKNSKKNINTFILQANNNINTLREYLSENGYLIIDESMAFAHGKYYEIIKAVKGTQILSNIEIEYGPINLKKKTALFINKWTEILNRYQSIIIDFKGSIEEHNRLLDKIQEIKNIIK